MARCGGAGKARRGSAWCGEARLGRHEIGIKTGDTIILIDTKEHFASYAQERFTRAGVESEIINLPYPSGCDYLISSAHGSCAIQRKDSIKEICGNPVSPKHKSAMEELTVDILPRLISFHDNPVLLVEETHVIGEMGYMFRREDKIWRETAMHSSSYFGFLEYVRNMGVDVVCTRNFGESLWYMIAMNGYLGKHHYPKHKKTFNIYHQAMGVLCCVPGIGERKAEKVLSEHRIKDLITLRECKGITVKQLEKIKEVLSWKSDP